MGGTEDTAKKALATRVALHRGGSLRNDPRNQKTKKKKEKKANMLGAQTYSILRDPELCALLMSRCVYRCWPVSSWSDKEKKTKKKKRQKKKNWIETDWEQQRSSIDALKRNVVCPNSSNDTNPRAHRGETVLFLLSASLHSRVSDKPSPC